MTVDPVASLRVNVCPAGTVKELIMTVVHSTADDTSSKVEMVPVHDAAGLGVTGVGLPNATMLHRDAKRTDFSRHMRR